MPRREIAAAVRALIDQQRAALRALTERRHATLRAWRERRITERVGAQRPQPKALPG